MLYSVKKNIIFNLVYFLSKVHLLYCILRYFNLQYIFSVLNARIRSDFFFFCGLRVATMFLIYVISSLQSQSDQDDDNDPDGPYAFRRKKNCNYHEVSLQVVKYILSNPKRYLKVVLTVN